MGLKDVLLKQGWAGTTISRAETIDRINPLLAQQTRLYHAYQYVLAHLTDPSVAAALDDTQKTMRADLGKLAETVFSSGGVAYNGTDLEPGSGALSGEDAALLSALLEQEHAFQEALAAEDRIEHQMRSRAILGVQRANSQQRLRLLNDLARKRSPRR
jgi:hypothetical protein